MSCLKCRSTALIRDDDTGQQVCSACGLLQEFDGFEAYFGGISAPEGTFVRLGTAGSGTVLSYHTKKLLDARSLIDDVALRLGLSAAKSAQIRATASEITDGEFGIGRWFTIFVAACAYVVMRAESKPLLIAEVSSVAGCDEHELGRMVERIVRFLDLRASNYPELNIVALFERSLRDSPSLSGGDTERMRKQGVFLVEFMVKRWLTTGRRPAPVVAAALALVGEANGIESAGIEAAARELRAKLDTCKKRYRELCEALVKVAQALPWGSNVTVKNIVKNSPLIIHFMEKKSSALSPHGSTNLESLGLDLDEAVRDVLRKDVGYGEISTSESRYFDRGRFLGSESSAPALLVVQSSSSPEEEVLPPSLVASREACQKRRERIEVAKRRIEMIAARPSNKKRRFEGDIDCEDMIVEALLLHGVRENDILTGHYNALMGLHVL